MFQRKTSIRFSDSIDPGETAEYARRMSAPATVEYCAVRFYPGNELNLSVRPFKQSETDQTSLVDFVGRDELVGDDDFFEFELSEPIDEGDELVVEVENTGSYVYDYHVDVIVDYLGGMERVANAIGGRF